MSSEAQELLLLLAGSPSAHGTYDPAPVTPGVKIEIRSSARTLREPATEELWDQHLAGQRPLGIIPLLDDDTSWWGCIDVDRYDVVHAELAQKCRDAKLPLLVTRSKSGGAHLFLLLSRPAPAAQLMGVLRSCAVRLGLGDCEIFPKQAHLIRERGDLGNWIIMPYFGATQEAVKHTGATMTIQEFVHAAHEFRTSLAEVVVSPGEGDLQDGPPCLQHLSAAGFPEGTRNNGLFALGVYARKKWPDTWRDHLEEMNRRFMRPPLPADEVVAVARNLERRDYNYKCSEIPLVNHCNRPLCLQRRFGVGDPNTLPEIAGLSVLDTDPPLWFMDLGEDRIELTTQQMQDYRSFHRVCMDRIHRCFRLMTQAAWIAMLAQAMEQVVILEAPDEASLHGWFLEILEDFCTNRQRGERPEDLFSGRPYWDKEHDLYYFRLRDLDQHLVRHNMRGMTRAQITARIRAVGGGHRQFTIKGKGVSVFWIAADKVTPTPPVDPPPLDEEVI